jgi:uncharacterized protein YbbK (DUF523 family)
LRSALKSKWEWARRAGDELRMVTVRTGRDYTVTMNRWADARVAELVREDLCGYVLKSDSPSCGMESVKVYGRDGVPTRSGRGLFAEVLMKRMPWLPVEDEVRLRDPQLRDNFLERVLALRRSRG